MCEEVRRMLLERVAATLRQSLAGVIHLADMDAVAELACRQLQYNELSCPAFCKEVAALPSDPEVRKTRLKEWADALCQGVANAQYVLDCERVARFLASGSDAERRQIVNEFWQEYAPFAYGGTGRQGETVPRGCLGAQLIRALGQQVAGNVFADAQTKLDEKVFTPEGFGECARQYEPRKGKRFGNFFRQWIRQRAGDVVRKFPGNPREAVGGPRLDDLSAPQEEPDETGAHAAQALKDLFERFIREHPNDSEAERKVAAVELRYKAYRDPEEMMPSTIALVKAHQEQLQKEFCDCLARLRNLEDAKQKAELKVAEAGQRLAQALAALERGGCQGGLEQLEQEAAAQNMTVLRANWQELPPNARGTTQGLGLAYQIAWKKREQARRNLERVKVELGKWHACRQPWVRSEKEIGVLLGTSQSTVSRDLACFFRWARRSTDRGVRV